MALWNMSSTKQLEQYYFDQLVQQITAPEMPRRQFMVWQVSAHFPSLHPAAKKLALEHFT